MTPRSLPRWRATRAPCPSSTTCARCGTAWRRSPRASRWMGASAGWPQTSRTAGLVIWEDIGRLESDIRPRTNPRGPSSETHNPLFRHRFGRRDADLGCPDPICLGQLRPEIGQNSSGLGEICGPSFTSLGPQTVPDFGQTWAGRRSRVRRRAAPGRYCNCSEFHGGGRLEISHRICAFSRLGSAATTSLIGQTFSENPAAQGVTGEPFRTSTNIFPKLGQFWRRRPRAMWATVFGRIRPILGDLGGCWAISIDLWAVSTNAWVDLGQCGATSAGAGAMLAKSGKSLAYVVQARAKLQRFRPISAILGKFALSRRWLCVELN